MWDAIVGNAVLLWVSRIRQSRAGLLLCRLSMADLVPCFLEEAAPAFVVDGSDASEPKLVTITPSGARA